MSIAPVELYHQRLASDCAISTISSRPAAGSSSHEEYVVNDYQGGILIPSSRIQV